MAVRSDPDKYYRVEGTAWTALFPGGTATRMDGGSDRTQVFIGGKVGLLLVTAK